MRNIDWLASLTSKDIAKLYEEDGRCALCANSSANNGGSSMCGFSENCDEGMLSWLTADYVELDTQERIDADARKPVSVYWECGGASCGRCPSTTDGEKPNERYGVRPCDKAQTLDLLRRQRELDARAYARGAADD